MRRIHTHYDTLQVAETAGEEVIRGAFRHLAQRWHPDRNQDNPEEAARMMRAINESYQVLSDVNRRREYDHWLAEERGGASTQEPAGESRLSDARRQQMVIALGDNRVRWIEVALVFVLVGLVGQGTEHGLPFGYGVLLAVGATGIAELIRRPASNWAYRGWFSRPDAYLQARYDRFLSVRVLHLGGRGSGWVMIILAFWNGLFQPWVQGRKGSTSTASIVQTASPPPAPLASRVPAARVPTAVPVIPVGPYRIRISNQCNYAVSLAVSYLPTSGEWATLAWYDIGAGETRDLTSHYGPLLTNNSIMYYFARTPNGEFIWKGRSDQPADRILNVNGVPHSFRHWQRQPHEQDVYLPLTCTR